MAKRKRAPARHLHPGEVLKQEFLVPLGISANRLATSLGMPANRIAAIVKGERAVTAETAVLLGKAFKTTPEFWINLQYHYELGVAKSIRAADRSRKRSGTRDDFGREILKLKGTVDPNLKLEF